MNVLDILKEGKSISTREISELTGNSPEMITVMLERYEALGYIRKVHFSSEGCIGSCKGCKGCLQKNISTEPMTFWELCR